MIDWQPIATLALGSLCSSIWWEVRQLRRAKHADAQTLQYLLISVAILARHTDCELPERIDKE